jgi:RNA polymerase sigma factor (sigma-70 family)
VKPQTNKSEHQIIALFLLTLHLLRKTEEQNMKGKNKDKRTGDHFVDHYPCLLTPRRKKRGRIRHLDWATELYGYWDVGITAGIQQNPAEAEKPSEIDELVDREVRQAIEKLTSEESRFIQLFYFEFRSYQEVARRLGKRVYKLERIHQRALGKLKILLAEFVRDRFGLTVPESTDCIICNSPHRQKLDQLIRNKKDEETYARLIRIFREKYGVKVKTPQVIIGHKKKHMV